MHLTLKLRLSVLALGLALVNPVFGMRVIEIDVKHIKGNYHINFKTLIAAKPEKVRQLLTDYNHLDRLSKTIKQSRLLKTFADGRHRVKIVMRGCFLFLCKTVIKVEDVVTLPNGDIVTTIIPKLSDYDSGNARWQIRAHRHGTLVQYTGEMAPRLRWPFIIKYRIRKELRITVRQLERLAPL